LSAFNQLGRRRRKGRIEDEEIFDLEGSRAGGLGGFVLVHGIVYVCLGDPSTLEYPYSLRY
jgi:hypothetical protein